MNQKASFWHQRSETSQEKDTATRHAQIFVSGPLGVSTGKEFRILTSSIAQRWPKTLLYHSGDRPLGRQEGKKITWTQFLLILGRTSTILHVLLSTLFAKELVKAFAWVGEPTLVRGMGTGVL